MMVNVENVGKNHAERHFYWRVPRKLIELYLKKCIGFNVRLELTGVNYLSLIVFQT